MSYGNLRMESKVDILCFSGQPDGNDKVGGLCFIIILILTLLNCLLTILRSYPKFSDSLEEIIDSFCFSENETVHSSRLQII